LICFIWCISTSYVIVFSRKKKYCDNMFDDYSDEMMTKATGKKIKEKQRYVIR